MRWKTIILITIISSPLTDTKAPANNVQTHFSNLLLRQPFGSQSSAFTNVSDFAVSELQSIVSYLSGGDFNEALWKLKELLRVQRKTETETFLNFAGNLRNFPTLNYTVWLPAFLFTSYERDDLASLPKPHPLALTPEFFLFQEAYDEANNQALRSQQDRSCIRVNGNRKTGVENGDENELRYFTEDMFLGYQHNFWHLVHGVYEPNKNIVVERRGERFYYFHRSILARYDTERLAMGLDLVKPLVMKDGYIIKEGFFHHLASVPWHPVLGNRHHNTKLTGASEMEGWIENIIHDMDKGYLIAENGTVLPLHSLNGIDLLVNSIENFYPGINRERYSEYGIHNSGHELLGAFTENKTSGMMGFLVTSPKDPIFYRFHYMLDNICELHKKMLPPYETNHGELPLIVEGVNVTSFEVKSVNLSSPSPNILETFIGEETVKVPFTPDRNGLANNGTLRYCIKRLEHKDFQYKIAIVRSGTSSPSKATVKIFMAPRFKKGGESFSLIEQKRLIFQMDNFQVTLHPGENLVVQNSTQSTLTTIYNFQQAFEEDSEVEMQEAKYEKPSCGCGWPHHLLLPRGTTQGMHFDLFVIITDSIWLKSEPKDVCVAATILCGLRGGKYPDPFPMGYPFDRLPFIDPDTNEPVFSIEKYSQFIPNSKVTRVTILHRN